MQALGASNPNRHVISRGTILDQLDKDTRWSALAASSANPSNACHTESTRQLRKLALVAQYTDNAVIITDPQGRVEWVNQSFSQITGYTFEEVIGRNPGALLQGPRSDPRTIALMHERLRHGQGFKTEIVNYSKSGREYLLELDVQPVHDETGRLENFIAIERDVTESSTLLRLALETARQGVWHWEPGSAQVILSAHFLPLFGYDAASCGQIDSQLCLIAHPEDEAALREWYRALILNDTAAGCAEIEYRIATASGQWCWILTQGKVIGEAGNAATRRIVGIHSDITARKQAELDMRRMAYFDSLTGLANRALLMNRLDQAISLARRQHGQIALLFLDLDNFKTINDALGHEGGDALLVDVARRIQSVMRAECVLARLGSDEFVLLLPDTHQAEDTAIVARRILDTLAEPHLSGQEETHVTASIGMALFPADGEDGATLLKNAGTAMHAAKTAGRNTYRFFAATMGDAVTSTLRLKNRLRMAIRHNHFHLAYQPKVDAQTRQIVGMEALLRWKLRRPGLATAPTME